METPEQTQLKDRGDEPTGRQAERAAALRRFNLLFVYGPIGLFATASVAIVVILLIVAIDPPSDQALLTISGLADVALTIALVPVIVVGAILLALIAYTYIRGRRRGMAPIRQTQRLLWRMDNVMGQVRLRTSDVAATVTRPFITLQGAYAYLRSLARQITNLFRRS